MHKEIGLLLLCLLSYVATFSFSSRAKDETLVVRVCTLLFLGILSCHTRAYRPPPSSFRPSAPLHTWLPAPHHISPRD